MVRRAECAKRTAALSLFALVCVAVTARAGRVIEVPSAEAQTISHAFIKTKPGDTVLVEPGVYRERVFVEAGTVLKARDRLEAVIDGKGKGTVVTLGRNSSISGFVIRNGTIGVFSKHSGNAITWCRIVRNWQTGIICVRHLPSVEDNIIAFNGASGIQGWDVRSVGPSILHNTIAYNSNHGVAMGGKSNLMIEYNIIAHNERFHVKLLPESDKVRMVNNNFYRNLWSPSPLPTGNFAYDPRFMAPRTRMDFTSAGKVACPECPEDEAPGIRVNTYEDIGSSSGGDF